MLSYQKEKYKLPNQEKLKKILIDSEYDVHELLKGEQKKIDDESNYDPTKPISKAKAGLLVSNAINVESIFGISTKYQLQRSLHPQVQYTKNYVILDSKNRVPSQNLKQMQWLYISDALFQQGTVNTKGQVRDLIGMRIYPIRAAQNFGLSGQYNPSFTLLIEEFKAQSVIGQQQRNYHFLLRQTPNPTVPPAAPVFAQQEFTPMNDGYFWFHKPFTTINSFTISLGNPLVVINIPVAQQILYPQDFTYGLITTITTTFATGYSDGDVVVLSNFTTANPIGDAVVIAQMNSPSGHIINVLDAYTFTIAVDTSTITPLENSRPIYITNENLRVIIPIELIYIAPDSNDIDA